MIPPFLNLVFRDKISDKYVFDYTIADVDWQETKSPVFIVSKGKECYNKAIWV